MVNPVTRASLIWPQGLPFDAQIKRSLGLAFKGHVVHCESLPLRSIRRKNMLPWPAQPRFSPSQLRTIAQ